MWLHALLGRAVGCRLSPQLLVVLEELCARLARLLDCHLVWRAPAVKLLNAYAGSHESPQAVDSVVLRRKVARCGAILGPTGCVGADCEQEPQTVQVAPLCRHVARREAVLVRPVEFARTMRKEELEAAGVPLLRGDHTRRGEFLIPLNVVHVCCSLVEQLCDQRLVAVRGSVEERLVVLGVRRGRGAHTSGAQTARELDKTTAAAKDFPWNTRARFMGWAVNNVAFCTAGQVPSFQRLQFGLARPEFSH